MSADLIFWLAIALAGYTFAGYPALALVLAKVQRKSTAADLAHGRSPKSTDESLVDATPPVTVVLAARNECGRLRGRIENLLASDYPADRIDILIVDDGSDDGSCEVVRSLGLRRTRVLRLPEAGGKALALNAAMGEVRTPITVFADARQRFSPGTIAALVAALAEPGVAVVSGEVHTLGADADGNAVAADGSYARIERALRHAEGQLGWAHAACGAVYAIRTEIFRTLPAGLVLDDVFTPIQALRQGLRIRVEPAAVAADTPSQALHQEFRRKLRTLSGNWQLIALQPWLLSPTANPVWFAWVSHKLLRLLAPWALLAAFVSSALATGALARAAFWLQLGAYGIAAATVYAPRLMRHVPLATTAGSFVTLNAAALLSLPMYLRHRDLRRLWRA